jgi:hypothetical protein
MSTSPRVKIKDTVSPNTPAGWLKQGKGVVTASKGAGAPVASIQELAQLDTDTQALDAAQAKAKNRGRAEVTARDAAWKTQQTSYRAFVGEVQKLCDAAPDAEHAKAIAAAAGLQYKLRAPSVTPDLRGKALGNGQVRLYGRRPTPKPSAVFYEWQQLGADGKTWTTFATTNKARALIEGLTPMTSASFRYRKTVKDVPGEWSQTVAVAVR